MICSVINYKGGVGKTTVTANIAAQLAREGNKVLLVDLDPQTNLTFSFIRVDEWKRDYQDRTIKRWYDSFIDSDQELHLQDLVIRPFRVNERLREMNSSGSIDLISSHLGLINVDLELSAKLWGGSERSNRRNFLFVYSRLKEGLKQLEAQNYDYIFIDCPPNFNVVTKTAIVASDTLLIPARPDYLSTIGIEQLQRHAKELVFEYNNKLEKDDLGTEFERIAPTLAGVVFTMVEKRRGEPISALRQYIEQVINQEIPAFETVVRENKTVFSDAPELGVPVVLQRLSGDTYRSIQTELKELTEEFEERLSNGGSL
ncbi:AAA family ATPase [Anaerobacillus sp. CMMVII]|uniref:ParA family protein n=1 Tax=Anaerobacillus sp. CMMVII TaxID=2755588 RepID=UPI0021B7E83D|nr:AAA family ATPase [Anaerobacillus sp. CMMVII]MCT8139143.1 AAA family ATPase [Anaerobacillus sp. CMMVII]